MPFPCGRRIIYAVMTHEGHLRSGAETAERKKLSKKEARELVLEGMYRIEAGDNRARCVDGRCAGKDLPPGARPGGDAGDLMAVLAALRKLDIGPEIRENVFDLVLQSIGGPENFYLHTDEHGGKMIAGGCGHVSGAFKDPLSYGLQKDDMDWLEQKLKFLKSIGTQEVVLQGQHQEGAVIVIESEDFSAYPSGEAGQAFIYQRSLHKKALAALAERLKELPELAKIDSARLTAAMTEASETQLAATLKELTKNIEGGLPLYVAEIDAEGNMDIRQEGTV